MSSSMSSRFPSGQGTAGPCRRVREDAARQENARSRSEPTVRCTARDRIGSNEEHMTKPKQSKRLKEADVMLTAALQNLHIAILEEAGHYPPITEEMYVKGVKG